MNFRYKLNYRIRAALVHLFFSSMMVGLIVFLIAELWFKSPWMQVMGGVQLLLIIFLVDLVCGPILTFFIFDIAKPYRELIRDVCIIAGIQLIALCYGLHVASQARPIALVFEVDRIRAVSYADLDEAEASQVPDWAQPWRLNKPRMVVLAPAKDSTEKWERLVAALNGQEASLRPSQWLEYASNSKMVMKKSAPIEDLIKLHPDAIEAINSVTKGENSKMRWLPLVSRRSMDWVVFFDLNDAVPIGYLKLDGFK